MAPQRRRLGPGMAQSGSGATASHCDGAPRPRAHPCPSPADVVGICYSNTAGGHGAMSMACAWRPAGGSDGCAWAGGAEPDPARACQWRGNARPSTGPRGTTHLALHLVLVLKQHTLALLPADRHGSPLCRCLWPHGIPGGGDRESLAASRLCQSRRWCLAACRHRAHRPQRSLAAPPPHLVKGYTAWCGAGTRLSRPHLPSGSTEPACKDGCIDARVRVLG